MYCTIYTSELKFEEDIWNLSEYSVTSDKFKSHVYLVKTALMCLVSFSNFETKKSIITKGIKQINSIDPDQSNEMFQYILE